MRAERGFPATHRFHENGVESMELLLDKKNIQPELINAINQGSDVVFISYSMIETTEEQIKFALARILEKYGKEEYLTPIFSCIKELTSNATKANAKRLLLEEGIITETDDIIDIVRKLRSILNEEALLEYGIKSKLSRLSTRTYLKMQGNRLVIEVINNLPLAKRDLARINERIEKSSKYDSIAEFYLENPDPAAEGMGLGLSMVVLLLKSINISYKSFSVTTDGRNKTRARITVPL